jgi:hypothetical protein
MMVLFRIHQQSFDVRQFDLNLSYFNIFIFGYNTDYAMAAMAADNIDEARSGKVTRFGLESNLMFAVVHNGSRRYFFSVG